MPTEPELPVEVDRELRAILAREYPGMTPVSIRFLWTGIGQGQVTFTYDGQLLTGVIVGEDADRVRHAENGWVNFDREQILRTLYGPTV